MKIARQNILWVDCIGGLLVGCSVLAIHSLLSKWENLPISIVLFMGVVNLLYGIFSLHVTTRTPRPAILVKILAIANMLWVLPCIGIVCMYWPDISTVGILFVLGEGVYVATLGFVEWGWRSHLSED